MVANFSAAATAELVNEIDVLITMSGQNKRFDAAVGQQESRSNPRRDEAMRQAVEGIDHVLKIAESAVDVVKSRHVKNAIKRLRGWNRGDGDSWETLFSRACALRDSLRIELGEFLFYIYPKEKGQKHKEWPETWRTVCDAFPEARIESYNATDCYALGHDTASVFHSMRVAEIGLRALAKERRIALPKNKAIEWATWHEIIKALDAEIKRIGETEKAGSSKDAALTFYSGARADLNGFKDEFRNLVMHVRGQYDEFQALRALTQVHDFMARIAGKIDHRHHRIRWGRAS